MRTKIYLTKGAKVKKCIQEEIEVITHNLDVVLKKLQTGTLSTAGSIAAEELIKTLAKVRDFLADEASEAKRVGLLLSQLPLLYFQIPKLN